MELFRASGAAELLQRFLSPFFSLLGIPVECALLVLVRPISGSAALAVGTSLMQTYGVNSQIGRTAAVMLGSTETTFYTISVYFGCSPVSAAPAIPCPPPFLPILWASPRAWTQNVFLGTQRGRKDVRSKKLGPNVFCVLSHLLNAVRQLLQLVSGVMPSAVI